MWVNSVPGSFSLSIFSSLEFFFFPLLAGTSILTSRIWAPIWSVSEVNTFSREEKALWRSEWQGSTRGKNLISLKLKLDKFKYAILWRPWWAGTAFHDLESPSSPTVRAMYIPSTAPALCQANLQLIMFFGYQKKTPEQKTLSLLLSALGWYSSSRGYWWGRTVLFSENKSGKCIQAPACLDSLSVCYWNKSLCEQQDHQGSFPLDPCLKTDFLWDSLRRLALTLQPLCGNMNQAPLPHTAADFHKICEDIMLLTLLPLCQIWQNLAYRFTAVMWKQSKHCVFLWAWFLQGTCPQCWNIAGTPTKQRLCKMLLPDFPIRECRNLTVESLTSLKSKYTRLGRWATTNSV